MYQVQSTKHKVQGLSQRHRPFQTFIPNFSCKYFLLINADFSATSIVGNAIQLNHGPAAKLTSLSAENRGKTLPRPSSTSGCARASQAISFQILM